MAENPHAFTGYGWACCLWILVVSFQYGYHISALNQIQAVLSCRDDPTGAIPPEGYGLPTCIPMSDATFSVVTAVYTVGGLLGSLVANVVMDRAGRKGAVQASSALFVLGAAIMSSAASLWPLIIGRVLVGVGAGFGLCVGPIFLSEIAPSKIQGAVGVLTQFAIVIGIMITQAMGLRLATPHEWRLVLVFSAALSFGQLLLSPLIVESPVWLHRRGLLTDKAAASRKLWAMDEVLANEPDFPSDSPHDPLLGDVERDAEDLDVTGQSKDTEDHQAAISILQLFTARELQRPLIIVCFSMLCQQLSGVNAVLYYSNDILSKALPDIGPFVSLGITIVNVIMTFPPIFLIERLGRKTLLSMSAGGALLSLVGVGYGLDTGVVALASITILTFVASFAIGIGPVPFVMIPEVSPRHAVSALSSVGLSLNWIANFLVGLVFLPLRNQLSGGDPYKEGRIFYVFAAMLGFCTFVLFQFYRG
ncbi:MFS general substrate transporter [Phanerochaete sordida]|uniref:MFS general substrate transporter n=1 Tax=Phanerochaete sordida TaxID=48140 RepID=A0A9P3G2S4_9APHY|nr:MFS general substrate transporter [Phanerochaete sordida]